MAIKVNGTTVIDDSRNLVNIASGAGSSTTYGDVGTYVFADKQASGGVAYNSTHAGSTLRPAGYTGTNNSTASYDWFYGYFKGWSGPASTLSGTWRAMGEENYYTPSSYNRITLFVRIS